MTIYKDSQATYVKGTTGVVFRTDQQVDLDGVKAAISALQTQLAMPAPSTAELAEYGRMVHPYYQRDRAAIQKEIDDLAAILTAAGKPVR